MCLFEGEIEWMENFREKIGRKTFWSVFGWVGGRKINGGAQPRPTKKFSPQIGEKTEGRK